MDQKLGAQGVHAVLVPSAVNAPAAQVWHALLVPSTKYWPAAQHLAFAAPAEEQRLVVPAAQAGLGSVQAVGVPLTMK